MKRIWKAKDTVEGWNSKPIRIPRPEDPDDDNSPVITADATVRDVMNLVASNAPYKTIEDSKEGRRVAEALEEAKKSGVIELDQGSHNWLKKASETICPQIFRINGEIVHDLIAEGYKRENEPKGKKEKAESEE